MRLVNIDIETYSDINLLETGVYKYVESPNFTVLMLAYKIDHEPTRILDFTQSIDWNILHDIFFSADTVLSAFNANFERVCLNEFLQQHHKPMIPIEKFHCTAAQAKSLGLPSSLASVAKTLQLEQQKDTRGTALIRLFSIPNRYGTRTMPYQAPDEWEAFKAYCVQDVDTERSIYSRLQYYPVKPLWEKDLYVLDQKINDRGVKIDVDVAEKASLLSEDHQYAIEEALRETTGLFNPTPQQLLGWLNLNDCEMSSLSAKAIEEKLQEDLHPEIRNVLQLRSQLGKTSIAKIDTMLRCVGRENRVRGLFQYHGASTGRWTGRLVQVHNLPRNTFLTDLETARDVVATCDKEIVEILYDDVQDTISQLIRTLLVPEKGHKLIVSDFSAIEARVIAWLANEDWRLDVFRTHGKIYEASASQMFNVPLESITKDSPLRQKGKIAELALGYGGGAGALLEMGAREMGLETDEMYDLVRTWRDANPNIARLWKECENAALFAVRERMSVTLPVADTQLLFFVIQNTLFITLPSGRSIAYWDVQIEKNQLTYMTEKQKKWCRTTTYGGKLVENIVQAIARDCLAHAMLQLDKEEFSIIMHVHDEVVIEKENATGKDMECVESIMKKGLSWAKSLPLQADSFIADFYQK